MQALRLSKEGDGTWSKLGSQLLNARIARGAKNEEVMSAKTTSSTREMLKVLKNELAREREQKAELKAQVDRMKDILLTKQ